MVLALDVAVILALIQGCRAIYTMYALRGRRDRWVLVAFEGALYFLAALLVLLLQEGRLGAEAISDD